MQVLYSWLVRPSDTRNVDGSNPSTCTMDEQSPIVWFSLFCLLWLDLGYVTKLPPSFQKYSRREVGISIGPIIRRNLVQF